MSQNKKFKYNKYFVVSATTVIAAASVVPFSASAENVEIKFHTTDDTNLTNKAASLPVASTVENTTTGDTGGVTTEDTFTLSIIHTNDTHANITNAPKRATIINNVREEKPNALLLDAGDVFQGTLYFTEYKGQADLELMNYMGYDAMTLGNHEFDLGKTEDGHQALVDFIQGAEFPILTSNVDFSADEKFNGLYNEGITTSPDAASIYDGMIVEIDGEEIGIFGLTTETTAGSSSPEKVTFENYIEEAEKAVQSFEQQGVDKIVALTHLGFNNPADSNDLLLAAEVEGIDIIVGGHSHTTLTEAYVVEENADGEEKDPTVIVQTGSNSANVGTLDVEFDENGVIVQYDNELIAISNDIPDDPDAARILKPYTDGIAAVENEETGGSTKNVLENPRLGDPGNTGISVRNSETVLGNLVADSMLAQGKKVATNATIALQNGGGVRSAVDAGPITMGDVLKVLSFNNGLYSVELTGAELRNVLEGGVAAELHESGAFLQESGSFLHVAGLKFEYDRTKPVGERVVSVQAADENGLYSPLEDTTSYTLITNSYIALGNGYNGVFEEAAKDGRVTDIGLSDWESFAAYLGEVGEVNPQVESRIVDVAGQVLVAEKSYDFKNYQTDKLIITQPSVTVKLDKTSNIENGILFTGEYAEFEGEGFENTTVTIRPEKAGTVIDLKGTPVKEITVKGPFDVEFKNNAINQEINIVEESLNFTVLSDIHYYDKSLGTTGEALDSYLENDRKLLIESKEVLEAAVSEIKLNDSEVVLISGDLTKDGELIGHQKVVEILQELEAAGKKVYVTHGNHDINNPHAVKFVDNTTEAVETVTVAEYKDLYKEFGYEEAIAVDPNSLSYVVQPKDGVRIIIMDSVLYEDNQLVGKPVTEGEISKERLAWILEQIHDAKVNGDLIFGMTHHGVVEHFGVQEEIFPQYVIKDWDYVSTALADAGLNVVFTGHFHAQDAVTKTTTSGNIIYDIETGSLVTFPSPYREVVIDDGKMSINTETVKEIAFNTNGKPFPEYAEEFLGKGMETLVPTTLAQLLESQGLPPALAEQQAQALTDTVVAPNVKLGDIITDALIQHYTGDEKADPITDSVVNGLRNSTDDPMKQFLGNALYTLFNDETPDNQFEIDLTSLNK